MAEQYDENDQEYEQGEYYEESKPKQGNNLATWGNPRTMNMNHLVLTNVQNSSYFKVRLLELKTYHEVVDEIYYKVDHLEPWERGTRKTAGQTGMCGGVRGVGAGGVVSTSFCCLFKLFTLKLTRKQVNGLLNHTDSPYIRGLGIMYVRYTQPPAELWDWLESYLEDEEEIDVKAGGGCSMTIGMMVRTVFTKLDWFSTLFPRIPVPIQKYIDEGLRERGLTGQRNDHEEAESFRRSQERSSVDRHRTQSRERSHNRNSRVRSPEKHRARSSSRDRHRGDRRHSRERRRSPEQRKREKRSRSRERRERRRSRSRERKHERSRRSRSRSRDRSYRSR